MSMTEKTRDFDITKYLKTGEQIAYYLEAVLDEDPLLLPAALREIARTRRGMTGLARQTGMSRDTLTHLLIESNDPRYRIVCKILAAYGIVLAPKHTVEPTEQTVKNE